MAAQKAVADYPDFKGNVVFVPTRGFYRPAEVSPSKQAYHWNNNAETYYLIGQHMAHAMIRLMKPWDTIAVVDKNKNPPYCSALFLADQGID